MLVAGLVGFYRSPTPNRPPTWTYAASTTYARQHGFSGTNPGLQAALKTATAPVWAVRGGAVPARAVVTGTAVLCRGTSTTIQATVTGMAPFDVTWPDGPTQTAVASPPATRSVSPGVPTTNTVTVLSDANCTGASTGNAVVTVTPLPGAVVTGDATLCAAGPTKIQAALSGTGPWTVTWSDGVVEAGVESSPATRVVSPASTTTYTVTSVTGGGCGSAGTGGAVITVGDTQPPAGTPPAAVTVTQSVCSPSRGATSASSTALTAFLADGTATDNCTASPTRLTAQVGGVDVTPPTLFGPRATSVTFRHEDAAGNIGTASRAVTVQLWGDLNLSNTVTSTDVFILSNYLVGNVVAGTPPFTAPLALADVNRSGAVSSTDLFILKSYLAGNAACLAP